MAYRIALPPDLVGMHDIFHVHMLRKYIANHDVIVEYEPLEIQKGLTYVEEPVKIVDKKDQVLRTKTIPIVKVLWCNHGVKEALNSCAWLRTMWEERGSARANMIKILMSLALLKLKSRL